MPKSEVEILSELLDSNRQLTKFYLSKLKAIDPLSVCSVNGIELNSYYWIIGHLAWAEYFLVVSSCLNQELEVPDWLSFFAIGGKINDKSALPSFSVVLDIFKSVHMHTLEQLKSFPDDQLGMRNHKGLNFSGDDSIRAILQHAIRHEGVHCGHLGLICKLNGITTV